MRHTLHAVARIDWNLLREQKKSLVNACAAHHGDGGYEGLDGLLNLIDALQDAAEEDGLWAPDEPQEG